MQNQPSFIDCVVTFIKTSQELAKCYEQLALPNPLRHVFTFDKETTEDVQIKLDNYLNLIDNRYVKNKIDSSEEMTIWRGVFDQYMGLVADNKFDFLMEESVIITRVISMSNNGSYYDVDLSSLYMMVAHPKIAMSADNVIKGLRNKYLGNIIDILVQLYPDRVSLHGVYSLYAPSIQHEAGPLIDSGMNIMKTVVEQLSPGTELNEEGINAFRDSIGSLASSSQLMSDPSNIKNLGSHLTKLITPDVLKSLIKNP